MRSIAAAWDSRSQNLHRFHSKLISRFDLRIRIVTNHNHFFRFKLLGVQYGLKDPLLAFPLDFINARRRGCL